jgi:hypothetical protein
MTVRLPRGDWLDVVSGGHTLLLPTVMRHFLNSAAEQFLRNLWESGGKLYLKRYLVRSRQISKGCPGEVCEIGFHS